MDSGAGDTVSLRELAQAVSAFAVPQDRWAVKLERLASDVPAFEPGAAHSSADPLDDQAALQFSNRSDDDDDSAAQWPAGVDLFTKKDVLDVQPVQLIEHIEEVFHRPGDPIRSPGQNDIETAAASVAHHLIQTRPPDFGPADPVHVLVNYLIAALLGHLSQIVKLALGALIESTDSQIKDGALHLRRSFGFRGEFFVT